MQNWHRHTYNSNIMTPDSTVSNEDYAKRAKELGHGILSSVEHGWQGKYHEVYELSKKYGLKTVIGSEMYWVHNRFEKDNSNHHILVLAKSEQGRQAINDVLSEANISGYYYRPRADIELLLSLPPQDVLITSACIVFSGYDDVDDIILQLHDHFQDNFLLEVQYHNTEKQKEWNKHLVDLSASHGIQLSVGLDSHYIFPSDAAERDNLLAAKSMHYEDEDGWYMDYPDDDEVLKRFTEQGVLTAEQIRNAMNITDQALEFCDYDKVRVFTKDIKLPSLYPNETYEQKYKRYTRLITKKFKEYMKNVPAERYHEYFDGVQAEVATYRDTGMVDYPLIDYAIVKDAIEHGGLITDSGRGSAVGFFTNTLCGFSKVDRFTSAIKLYPERFISTTRILETKSMPDIDMNCGDVSVFEESQKRILGEDHAVPMIAFGTLKKKAAFKMYARSQNMDFELANTISAQISAYDEAVKNADEEDKDLIDLYDYVDEQYKHYIEESKKYWGIISDKKKAPSAYLLYDGNIRKEIGLIKCKSESTGKEYITCAIDGAVAENFKFLKNDLLKVDVVYLIDKVFKRIGIEHFNVNTLIEKVKTDSSVWDIYKNGYTIGVNQVEQDGSRHKCMRYKPTNISELSAFVAAIRPGFKSMYSRFEKREDFSWGIPTLDNLLRTKELPVSFLFFQEQVMSVLNYAGFPMDECYGIIKAIAKKHPEKVKPLKQKFIDGFRERLIQDESLSKADAQENAEKVWQIVNDNCGYGFNSAHAYCMALDSLYQAWQKSHYPYEFYEVLLQHYTDKGKKDKVKALTIEMRKAFGIKEGLYRFGNDHRTYVADKDNGVIYPALTSIKGIGNNVSESLYEIQKNHYDSFLELIPDLLSSSINSGQLETLVKINFFEQFGNPNELMRQLQIYNNIAGRKQFKITDLDKLHIPLWLIQKHAGKATEKMFKDVDTKALVEDLINTSESLRTSKIELIKYEQECLGYICTTMKVADDCYYAVSTNKYGSFWDMYQLATGNTERIKFAPNVRKLISVGKIVQINKVEPKNKVKLIDGKWVEQDETEEVVTKITLLNTT